VYVSDEQGGSYARRQRDGRADRQLRLLRHSRRLGQKASRVAERDEVPADDDESDRLAPDEARTATGDVRQRRQAHRRHLQDARLAARLPVTPIHTRDAGNGFLHSHSLPFPCKRFPFLPIPIPEHYIDAAQTIFGLG